MSISIIGCGTLGKITANLFLKEGIKVKIILRNPETVKDLQEKGAEIIQGDVNSENSLHEACKDAEVILTAVHGMLGKGKNASKRIDDEAHCRLINIAKEAGVHQFIYTSASGASPNHPIDFWKTKYKVEQCLIASGLNYTIIRPSAFMETHMHFLIGKPLLEKGKVNLFGKGEASTNFISAADVAQINFLIYKNEEYYNTIIELGGPDNLSRNEVVNLYEKHSGKKARVTRLPLTVVKTLSTLIKPFHEGISRIMKVGFIGETVETAMDTSFTIKRFGLEPTSAEEFIKDQVSSHLR